MTAQFATQLIFFLVTIAVCEKHPWRTTQPSGYALVHRLRLTSYQELHVRPIITHGVVCIELRR